MPISSCSENKLHIYLPNTYTVQQTYLHPESIFHVHYSVLEDEDIHQVEDIHDAVVYDEPDVVVVLCLILREDVSEGNHPGVVEKAH